MVNALGADPASGILYNRAKGEAEMTVTTEGFPSLKIFRPSLLRGKREEFRLMEEVENSLSFILIPLFHLGLRKYQPVEISRLAREIYVGADEGRKNGGNRIFESDEIQSS